MKSGRAVTTAKEKSPGEFSGAFVVSTATRLSATPQVRVRIRIMKLS